MATTTPYGATDVIGIVNCQSPERPDAKGLQASVLAQRTAELFAHQAMAAQWSTAATLEQLVAKHQPDGSTALGIVNESNDISFVLSGIGGYGGEHPFTHGGTLSRFRRAGPQRHDQPHHEGFC